MTRKSIIPLAGLLAVSGSLAACGGAQIKEQQVQIGQLQGQLKERQKKVSELEAVKEEVEGKAADLGQKLKAAEDRIQALTKSNQDLSKALESNKGQLAGQIKELVAEKDELSRKLNDVQKEKIAGDRAKSNLWGKRERLLADLAELRQKHDDLEAQLAAARAEKDKEAKARSERLGKTREEMGSLADAVLKEIQAERAKISQSGGTIELILLEPLLFEPQQAKITEGGAGLLERLSNALRVLPPKNLRVEGHSDNSPIKWELFGRFTSHWDLSAARATAVARYLHEHAGLDPKRITAAGFGEFRPARGNDSKEGKAANRRLVLALEPAGS